MGMDVFTGKIGKGRVLVATVFNIASLENY